VALSAVSVTTQLTNHFRTHWSPRFRLDTTELGKLFPLFDEGEGEMMENGLYIRKVAVVTTNKVAGTVALDAESLTYEQDTELSVLVSPQFAYSAMAFSKQTMTRMNEFPAYSAAKRKQFIRSMVATIDLDAGGLMDDVGTVVGNGASNVTKDLLLQAAGELRTNAQREYEPTTGEGTCYFRLHPKQQRYLYGIDAITSANIRGSGTPNVTGILVEAWGINLGITGNVISSGGAYHNPLFLKGAFARAYNAEPQLIKEQWNGLAMLIVGFTEYGMSEIYDNFAVDLQTSTA
jgi:hypothetical protein